MNDFSLQGTLIRAPYARVFPYIANPATLPEWTNAFKRVSGARAHMQTPLGAVEVGLKVVSSQEHGTVDWHMTFPEGNLERAFSRVVDLGNGQCLYSFMLTPPAAPLERIEGTLAEQAAILAKELAHLKACLEKP
jgi:uncharacterized protein YndB with AHSA1/START domain